MNHTPTPWKYKADCGYDEDGIQFCEFYAIYDSFGEYIGGTEDGGKAEKIVHCVNMHEELIEIAKKMIEFSEDADKTHLEIYGIADKARAVLAKEKEE